MRNGNVDHSDSSIRNTPSRARASRILIISVCLVVMAGAAALPSGLAARVSAAIQQAASRTTTAAPKPRVLRQSKESQIVTRGKANSDGSIIPDKIITDQPIQQTSAEIMAAQAVAPSKEGYVRPRKQKERPDRKNLRAAPGAIEASQWPIPDANAPVTDRGAPQTLGTQFDGATGPAETGAFPPDTMGAVGPSQVVIFLNGRLKTFNKTTGAADGVINVDPDVFFASVMTPPLFNEIVFTSDPQVRFDRLSNRWFLNIIDVPVETRFGTLSRPNRILLAVSDAASNGNINGLTVWTFYQFQGDATLFTDYQSFGVDSSALYIGGNMFVIPGFYNSTKGFVIPKAPLLAASPATVWAFSGLAVGAGAGPFAPRGVDNYQVASTTEGYFIGVDNALSSALMLRRVTNPGSLGPAPTISANISITTPLTIAPPVLVPHLGDTVGINGALDGLDERLYYAHLRNGRLWTSHNIGVDNTGVAGATNNRNAVRWYELQNIISPGTPTVLQSGTLFDNNAINDANQRNYWIPSILVSGQGHAALGCSIAGTNERINAFTTGRLVGDPLGTLRDGPGGAALPGFTASASAYNPLGDPGGAFGRRWGDYSNTSLDPKDDMTMWTFQQYCDGTNTYGVRAVKLIAPPPPPTNTPNPGSISVNNPSSVITVTGTAPAGQGFYDPGPDPAAPHTPFTHISASGAGLIINSITYNTPTQVTLNVSTVGATVGAKTITITNPDGQSTTVQLLVGPTAAKVNSFTADGFDGGRVLLRWRSDHEIDNLGFNVYREANGQRTKINPQIIAGSALVTGPQVALTAGKSYAWSDQLTQAGTRYLLEDIDTSGKSSWTGPITLNAKGTKAPTIEESALLTRIGLASAQMIHGLGSAVVDRKAEIAGATVGTVKQQNDLAGQVAVKIGVKQEGWYRIPQQDLAAAGLSSHTEARNLQLFVDGIQVPMVVNGEADGRLDAADSIEFYGLGLNSAVTNTRVYWLVAGGQPGARINPTITNGSQNGNGSFTVAVERKDRTLYFAGLRNGETENFFGPVVGGAPVDQSLTLTNIAATSAQASLEVHLQGVTQTPHQVRVTFNGTVVGTVSFNGQGRGKASFPIPQNQLLEGLNTVQLIALGGGSDISLADSVRVSYAHTLMADSNLLRPAAKAGQPVTLGGFTSPDIRVIDVTDANNPRELIGSIGGSKNNSTITLTPPGVGTRILLAFTGARVMSAVAKANAPSNWHQEGLQHDYVMITTGELSPSLTPLKALRESQGLSVAIADVEDLYDEFSFGNKSPQAIKDFLRFTRDSWRQIPRFVLFAGDSSFDPKNYLGFGDCDLVPTKLYDSAYMEAVSDDWFVDFQATGFPEIASGRLPVRTAAEAAALVGKIVTYENSTASNSMLLTSDLNDGYNFAAIGETLRSLVPAGMPVTEIVRGSSDDATIKSRILAAINQGQTIVNYNGHGSVNQWRGNILTNTDAPGMTNSQKLSLFIMMTCLNGYFNDPALDSLAEALLKASGGASAVWASAGQCEPGGQEQLNIELYRLLFSGESITVGEASARAKQVVVDADVRRSWILFGDPAMKLK